jgi:imidazole glycerol-phosphate synthase subunit HisH
MKVGVIDYGMGNLRSVQSALQLFGAEVHITSERAELAACERVVLPGVGSFRRAMDNIRARSLDVVLHDLVDRGTPLLGICLGMQLLATRGTEDGDSEGLGFIDAVVEKFPFTDRPVPHVGFNTVSFTDGAHADFYFVHSYRMVCARDEDVAGWCDYGGRFAAYVAKGNVAGAQFHPEKSQSNGLKLLHKFVTSGAKAVAA